MNEKIILGGGCFWCTEAVFDRVRGVVSVTPGYVSEHQAEPSAYQQGAIGQAGWVECVEVYYNPAILSLRELLLVHLATHDATQVGGQGADIGPQYRSLVVLSQAKQLSCVQKVLQEAGSVLQSSLATEVWSTGVFYPAEEYHQQFYTTRPNHPYCQAVIVPKLKHFFEVIQKREPILLPEQACQGDALAVPGTLSPLEYRVLVERGTEPAFANEYWDNHQKGVYLCALCGQLLFTSEDKYDSGTGWPSFSQAKQKAVQLRGDESHGMVREEVCCARCGSHLGHVFQDGPAPLFLRYCINSCALVFEK